MHMCGNVKYLRMFVYVHLRVSNCLLKMFKLGEWYCTCNHQMNDSVVFTPYSGICRFSLPTAMQFQIWFRSTLKKKGASVMTVRTSPLKRIFLDNPTNNPSLLNSATMEIWFLSTACPRKGHHEEVSTRHLWFKIACNHTMRHWAFKPL